MLAMLVPLQAPRARGIYVLYDSRIRSQEPTTDYYGQSVWVYGVYGVYGVYLMRIQVPGASRKAQSMTSLDQLEKVTSQAIQPAQAWKRAYLT